jgi:hypothetical protein
MYEIVFFILCTVSPSVLYVNFLSLSPSFTVIISFPAILAVLLEPGTAPLPQNTVVTSFVRNLGSVYIDTFQNFSLHVMVTHERPTHEEELVWLAGGLTVPREFAPHKRHASPLLVIRPVGIIHCCGPARKNGTMCLSKCCHSLREVYEKFQWPL